MSSHPSRGVLVTGSSRGVGAAVARAFAAGGDRVVVHYLGSEGAAHGVCRSLPGDGHRVVQADLANPDAVQRLATEAIAALGRVDVLVNNAAMLTAPWEGRGRRGDHPLEEPHTPSGWRSGGAPWRPTCSARPT